MDSTLSPTGRTATTPQTRGRAGWFAGRQGRRLKEALLAYLFLLPAFVIIGTFGLFPLLFAAYQSTLKGINKVVGRFDGLGNYITAIDNLTYVLGLWGVIGLTLFAVWRVTDDRRKAAERAVATGRAEPYWPWALPGVLLGGAVAAFVAWILTALPLFLSIPDNLRGVQATVANFRHAAFQTLLLPKVQFWFWAAIGLTVLGALATNWLARRGDLLSDGSRRTQTNYAGVFAGATAMLALAATLAWLTWDELTRNWPGLEAGEQGDLRFQLLMMTGGIALLVLSWMVWRSANRSSSTLGMFGRFTAAIALMAGAWMLVAEVPLAIARGDQLWWSGLLNTFWYSLGTIPPQLIIALMLAALLFQKIRGRAVFRMLYFLPYIAPFVGTAAVFRIIFSSRPSAPMNAIITALGGNPQQWLAEPQGIFEKIAPWLPNSFGGPSLALVVIMIYGVWTFFGFNTVIFLAGLGSIPSETYEAASIDGAGRWEQFRHITLPLLSPTIYFLTLYSVIGTFKAFNHIYVLRTGAALGTTDTASVVIFQIFKRDLRFGYASALAILLLLIIIILTVVNNRLASKRVFYG